MTVSTHVYEVELIGSPDQPLIVQDDGGNSITLDTGSAPQVTAQLVLAMPSETVLDGLDPDVSPPPRVRVTATRDGGTPRVFDLGVRTRPVSHADGTVTVALASDEALADDWAPLADVDLYASAGDLNALVEEVLADVFGGPVPVSGPTADQTPYWDAVNIVRNPSFETGTHRWGVFGAAGARDAAWHIVGGWSLRMDGSGVDSYAHTDDSLFGAFTKGKTYTASADYRINAPLGGAVSPRARRIVAFVKAPSLGTSYVEYPSNVLPNTAGAQQRLGVTFHIPEDATDAFVRFYSGHSAGSLWIDAVSISPDSRHTPYFDGTFGVSPGYTYFWTGTAHDSTSQRHALVDSPSPEAFVWKAGQSALAFLAPLVQAAGLRLVCDEARAWSLRPETFTAPGDLQIRYGVNLVDGSEVIDRDSGDWYDAAVTTYKWDDPATGATLTRDDPFGLPGYSRLRRFEKASPWPGAGFSEYAVRRAQGRKREVTATIVADWATTTEQPMTVVLPAAPTQLGSVQRVVFDLDRDEMTVTARTTDTPEAAWLLIPAGDAWTDEPAGESWTEEVI